MVKTHENKVQAFLNVNIPLDQLLYQLLLSLLDQPLNY